MEKHLIQHLTYSEALMFKTANRRIKSLDAKIKDMQDERRALLAEISLITISARERAEPSQPELPATAEAKADKKQSTDK